MTHFFEEVLHRTQVMNCETADKFGFNLQGGVKVKISLSSLVFPGKAFVTSDCSILVLLPVWECYRGSKQTDNGFSEKPFSMAFKELCSLDTTWMECSLPPFRLKGVMLSDPFSTFWFSSTSCFHVHYEQRNKSCELSPVIWRIFTVGVH